MLFMPIMRKATAFVPAVVLTLGLLAVPASAQQVQQAPPQQAFVCPDNGSTVIASNVAGTTDKVISVTTSSGSDCSFVVEVYKTDREGNETVLDTVEHTCGAGPLVTVPPGARARVRDPQDGDSKKPKGGVALH